MKRVSVTALDIWQDCQQKWTYKFQHRLSVPIDAPQLTIGREFAVRLERALAALPGSDRKRAALESVTPGSSLSRCVQAVPEWVWNFRQPVSEDKLEVTYNLYDKSDLVIVGRPDIWDVLHEDGVPVGVVVYEFKTSDCSARELDRKLSNYEEWGVQPLRYAVLLHDAYDWLRLLPFYRQHIVVTHGGKCAQGQLLPVTREITGRVRDEMCSLAAEVGSASHHNFGPMCNYCEFRKLCTAWLTNADETQIISELGVKGLTV